MNQVRTSFLLLCILLSLSFYLSPCVAANAADQSAFWNACENCMAMGDSNWFCVQQGGNFLPNTYSCPLSIYSAPSGDNCLYESNSNSGCANLFCTQITVESQCNSTSSYAGQPLECTWNSNNNECENVLTEALEGLALMVIIWIVLGVCCGCLGICVVGGVFIMGAPAVCEAFAGCFGTTSKNQKQKKNVIIIQEQGKTMPNSNTAYVQMSDNNPNTTYYANTVPKV